MSRQVSDDKARESFEITGTPATGYRINCGDPSHNTGLWDFRQNALNKGYAHAKLVHGISSSRSEWAAGQRLFQEPPFIPEPELRTEEPV